MIRVCIGTEPKMELPRRVLEHSILRRTKTPVEFFPMIGNSWEEVPGGVTGFSFKRWRIPFHFNYEGHAIYLDADQVVLADIQELWNQPMERPSPGNVVWAAKKRIPLLSVMVIDCAAAGQHSEWRPTYLFTEILPKVGQQKLMNGSWIKPSPVEIPYEWNHIDFHEEYRTKILHYSDLRRQPWFYPEHPCAYIWHNELVQAAQSGYVTKEMLQTARKLFSKKRGLHPTYDPVLEYAKVRQKVAN